MQLRATFPTGTVGNACFVTLKSTVPEGEQVIDLDRDVEDMPGWGKLVILPEAVRLMNTLLGWDVDPQKAITIKRLRADVKALTEERDMLRGVIADLLSVANKAGIEPAVVESC